MFAFGGGFVWLIVLFSFVCSICCGFVVVVRFRSLVWFACGGFGLLFVACC